MESEEKFKVCFQRGDCFEVVAKNEAEAWKLCVKQHPHVAAFDVWDIISENHPAYDNWTINL